MCVDLIILCYGKRILDFLSAYFGATGKIIVNERDNIAFLSLEDLKACLRRVEHETTDLKFLNNQYIHKIKVLEKETKAKTEKIQQLQEKNLQAVVQTPGACK